MTVNPYTLQCLYEKGILDYVPYDLMGAAPMGAMTSPSNPYMQMASQGQLYQNYGQGHDSFSHSSDYISASANPGIYAGGGNNMGIGAYSQATPFGAYTQPGIGAQYANGIQTGAYNRQNMLGLDDNIGSYNRQTALGIDGAGGTGSFDSFRSGITNGVKTASSTISSMPSIVKNVAAAGIALLGIIYLFKRGKKPNVQQTRHSSFLSKINPKNWSWFKKK